MELEKASAIAEDLKRLLEPVCQKIVVAGSIRRTKRQVGDIELLVIPGANYLDRLLHELMMKGILAMRLNKRGSYTYGPKNKFLVHVPGGIGVDIFSTDEQCWWVSLAIRTGPKESNMAIAKAAMAKGWRLRGYGSGFSTPQGDVVCRSERDVFELVGLPYLPPEQRE
jgi:DNA polymerase (family 10)